MDNQRYFYYSGVLSLLLLFSFLSLFMVLLFHVKEIKAYGLKKKNYISVSIAVNPVKTVTAKKRATSAVSTVASEKKAISKNIDVNNLFSDVWTQKITHQVKKREPNSKRISEIQKQLKFSKTLPKRTIDKSLDVKENAESKKQKTATSTANEVNEYLAKIQAIVYQYFHVPPNTQGNSVKTVIELDPFGKVLDFRVLNYSASAVLNDEVDKIKQRLKNVVFPINPQGKSSKTIVVLISKE